MVIATLVFFIGQPFYIVKPVEGNVLGPVAGIILFAIKAKILGIKSQHWLDPALDKYSPSLVHDTKILLRILVLFIPVPLYWALYEQQASRWTFQATKGSIL